MQIVSRSPQRAEDFVIEVAEVDPATLGRCVARARVAQEVWREIPAPTRSRALAAASEAVSAAAGSLISLGVREVGKPLTEMAGEVERGVAILRYYAQAVLDPEGDQLPPSTARSLLFTRSRPHGVVGCITPWNFPVAIPLWKTAPALAFGNAVVLTPAPAATGIALRLADLLAPHLPDEFFQVVPGDAAAGSALGSLVDAVSFTGSAEVGHLVAAAAWARQIPVQTEMGDQNASLILPDANLSLAAEMVAQAAMSYAGQKCTATSRVVVVGNPQVFTGALVEAIERLSFGDPAEAGVVVGPVIDVDARSAVLAAVAGARAAGGRVLTGGSARMDGGYFVQPTLLDHLPPDHPVAQEEVFGPIAVLLPAANEDEAVRIANGVRHGLAAAVFTRDLDRALGLIDRLEAGLVRVNAPTTGVDFHAPFGGSRHLALVFGSRARRRETSTLGPRR